MTEELEALRRKILGDVVPLIVDGAEAGPEKFSLILRLIQSGNGDQAMFQKAYEVAGSIEDTNERLDAMMSLLDEIEIELTQPADLEAADDQPAPVAEPQEAPAPENNDQPQEQDNPQQ